MGYSNKRTHLGMSMCMTSTTDACFAREGKQQSTRAHTPCSMAGMRLLSLSAQGFASRRFCTQGLF